MKKIVVLIPFLCASFQLAAMECYLDVISNETDDPIFVMLEPSIVIKPHMVRGFMLPLRYGLGCLIKNIKKTSLLLQCMRNEDILKISATDPTLMDTSDSFLDNTAFFTHNETINPEKSYTINISIKNSDMWQLSCIVHEKDQ